MATDLGKLEGSLKLNQLQRASELARPWLFLALYIWTAAQGRWWLAVPLAMFTGLATFIQLHDAIHNALGLSKSGHRLVLSLSGLLLLKSGHALQATHLRHHGRCLSHDDPEGQPANWSLPRVMLAGPFHMLTLRLEALKIAPNRKRIQIFETVATVAILLLVIWLFIQFGSLIGLVYWLVAALLSASMPLWAAYLPHQLAEKNPAILAASWLSRGWTPVISSFAFHHLHHSYPKVPTALLPMLARQLSTTELPPDSDHDHHHHHEHNH